MDNHPAFPNPHSDSDIITSTLAKSLVSITSLDTESDEMRACLELAQEACHSQARVLIIGENGTGKSLLAQAIHYTSPMRGRACVTVECDASDRNGLDIALFGALPNSGETGFREGAFD